MTEKSEPAVASGVSKENGWSLERQSIDTFYIYYLGSWIATVRADKANQLLELLKQTR
jgi:hypothetical protein